MMAAGDRDESHPIQYAHWVWLIPLCVAFGPTLVWLVGRWTDSVWNLGPGDKPDNVGAQSLQRVPEQGLWNSELWEWMRRNPLPSRRGAGLLEAA